MRHEVVKRKVAVSAFGVGIERGEQGGAPFDTHAEMQTAALGPVLLPAQELRVTQLVLRFRDGSTTDATQNQLVPELV